MFVEVNYHMTKYLKKWWFILLLMVIGFSFYLSFKPAPYLKKQKIEANTSFDDFYLKKLLASREKKVRKENQEKLVRYADGPTETALLYIHGFGACRAEGEFVTDSIGSKLRANTYYLRLPGHGTNKDDHASVSFSDYIFEAEEALAMMPEIGKKTVIIATSMGGLLASYLAAEYPDKVDALILVSPFYDYGHVMGSLVNVPGIVQLFSLFDKKGRISTPVEQIKAGYILPEYPEFWYTEQKYEALLSLEDLKDYAAQPEIFRKITAPVLMFYYYENEEKQDKAASVKAMLNAYDHFPNALNKKVNIANGDHVMFSRYVRNDKQAIFRETFEFLDKVLKNEIKE